MTHIAKARSFVADESGATAIEYGLIAGLVALVVLTGIQALGGVVQTLYQLAAALF
ncbi:MAG: Flp family type IVb pilin [Alphaproteobacteria bacterium]|nr:Flp family type IVb pilin [Alphaproteobacteria bacterium]